mgnify:CR=1 FL=1
MTKLEKLRIKEDRRNAEIERKIGQNIKKIREEMGNATELGAELKEANKRKLRKKYPG